MDIRKSLFKAETPHCLQQWALLAQRPYKEERMDIVSVLYTPFDYPNSEPLMRIGGVL